MQPGQHTARSASTEKSDTEATCQPSCSILGKHGLCGSQIPDIISSEHGRNLDPYLADLGHLV